MSIKIDKISVKNCGPLNEFNENLPDLTLIYGKNEKGKSFLIEFVIQCLFRSKDNWGYLRQTDNGKVTVVGLQDKPVEFMPNTKNKLEDYFKKDPRGLPPSFAKLLVVKEGEVEIVKNETGIDKNTIKDILSPRRTLDLIDDDKKISRTVKDAKIGDGELNIDRRGEGKDYTDIKENLKKINEKINQLIQEYERGELKNLELQKNELEQKKEQLLKAKRYKAYKLSEDIKKLESEVNKIPEEEINKLKNLFNQYEKVKASYTTLEGDLKKIKEKTTKLSDLKNEIEKLLKAKRYLAYTYAEELKKVEEKLRKISDDELNKIERNISGYYDKVEEKKKKSEKLNELREKSKDYKWLESAKKNYDKFLTTALPLGKITSFLPYFSFLCMIISIVLIVVNQRLPGIILISVATFAGIYYLAKLKKYLVTYKQVQEFNSIKEEFKRKFNSELKDITQLESILDEQRKYFTQIEVYNTELEKLNVDIENFKNSIEESFKILGHDSIMESKWNEYLFNLKREKQELLNTSQKLREKLAELGVDESEYEKTDPGIKFDKNKFESLEKNLNEIESFQQQEQEKEQELKNKKEHLNKLEKEIKEIFKKIVCTELSESEWEDKIKELENARNNILGKINEKRGELLGLGVTEEEYQKDDPGIEFLQLKFNQIENKLKELEEKIKKEEEKILNLKSALCSFTGTDVTIGWNELIEKLYLKRETVEKELEDIEAKIISGIIVHETIEELRKEEDEKLLERLNSEEVKDLLRKLTGRYVRISFEEEDITISDDYQNFSLKDLSTGSKEQVMFALRVGFAKKILKQDSAFLILDDAFQHSDYDKRPILVNMLFELVKDGWQVVYLTMDDHIKKLFEEKSKGTQINFKTIYL